MGLGAAVRSSHDLDLVGFVPGYHDKITAGGKVIPDEVRRCVLRSYTDIDLTSLQPSRSLIHAQV